MASFEPIQRTGQEVRGTDPEYPGLMVVEVALAPAPPREWVALWNPIPPNSNFTISFEPPRISGTKATLRVPDDQITKAVEMLDGQIAAANDWYEKQVFPRLQAAEDRAQQEAEDTARRIEEAQKQLDELEGPDDEEDA